MAETVGLAVALLARAGDAREQLRQALVDLGAEVRLACDPAEMVPGDLDASAVAAVLVSVDAVLEPALDRLDSELRRPGLKVVYDEAETSAKLQGWDRARWARHLAAKLLGGDVFPPGADAGIEEAAHHLEPGAPPSPAQLAADARIDDFAEEVTQSAEAIPVAALPGEGVASVPAEEAWAPSAWAATPVPAGDPEALQIDPGALAQAFDAEVEVPERRVVAPSAAPSPDAFASVGGAAGLSILQAREIDLARFEATDASGLDVEEISLSDAELAAFGASLPSSGTTFSQGEALADIEVGEIDMDPELARLAASFDENLDAISFEPAPHSLEDRPDPTPRRKDPEPPPVPDVHPDVDAGPAVAAPPLRREPPPVLRPLGGLSLASTEAPAAPPPPAAKPTYDLGALALAPMEDAPAAAPPPPVAASKPTFAFDLGHLSLAPLDDGADAGGETSGLVLVLSGVGGPDAVRSLLRALPAGFPLAVVLRQTLEGHRHDRFVEQLAKISRLPIALAEAAETPPPRAVRVLPEGLGSAGALPLSREGGVAGWIATVSARGGAVLVLSGTDPSAIEPLTRAMADGLRVLVQDPASCFDDRAASALRDAGAPALAATDLAARLDAYFPT